MSGRRARGLVVVSVLLATVGVAVGMAWYLVNTVDTDLRPWSSPPPPQGLVHGARHEGWLALVGLQKGHLGDPQAQGLKGWTAWNEGRKQVLAMTASVSVPEVPQAIEIDNTSPLWCKPDQCVQAFEQAPALPQALAALSDVSQACDRVARAPGFEEPAVLVPAVLTRPAPGTALGTCNRLWLAQLARARQGQGTAPDAQAALRTWMAMHRVSSELFDASNSLMTGLVAAIWLQAAHAEGLALARTFPALREPIRQALSKPVAWQQVPRRWWMSEAAVLDMVFEQALALEAEVSCDKGVCTTKHIGGPFPFPRLKPYLPNLSRSRLRERCAAVIAAQEGGDPAEVMRRLRELQQRNADTAWLGLHFHNTVGQILLNVGWSEQMPIDYLPRVLDAELSRQATLLGLELIGRDGAAATPLDEAALRRRTDGAPFLKGRLHCQDGCRTLALTSWREDAKAPHWVLRLR